MGGVSAEAAAQQAAASAFVAADLDGSGGLTYLEFRAWCAGRAPSDTPAQKVAVEAGEPKSKAAKEADAILVGVEDLKMSSQRIRDMCAILQNMPSAVDAQAR